MKNNAFLFFIMYKFSSKGRNVQKWYIYVLLSLVTNDKRIEKVAQWASAYWADMKT